MPSDTFNGNLVAPRWPHHAASPLAARFEREMETANLSASAAARQELEESWRSKLEETHHRYRTATEAYRHVLQTLPEGLPPRPDGAVGRARQAESEALAEYARVLRIFTDLTIHGKMPDQQSATSDGVI